MYARVWECVHIRSQNFEKEREEDKEAITVKTVKAKDRIERNSEKNI